MGWLKRKNSREPSPDRHNGDASSVGTSDERKKPGFKGRLNDKNRWYWKFVQQRLPGWAPILTAHGVVLYFFITALICVAIGVPVLIASLNIEQYSLRYDSLSPFTGSRSEQQQLLYQEQGSGRPVTGSIQIEKTMEPPIYVFYELGKYYQNHKRYVRSRADQQLGGRGTTASSCEPERYVNGSSNSALQDGGQIDPCGLTAWSFFNDSYTLSISGSSLPVDESRLAWSYDRNHLYGAVNPVNFNIFPDKRGGNTTTVPINQNEHLMVWLRPAAKPTLRKLWGRIDQRLQAGTVVSVNVQNRYNTYNYGGQKRLILTTNSWVGGRNLFMGIAYLVVAGLNFIASIVFFSCSYLGLMERRKFGDLSRLSWNRKQ